MKTKMTWEERRQMHLDLHNEHWAKARQVLRRYTETHDRQHLTTYETEYHLSNKHWGIAEGMWTRKYGNL